MILLVKKKVKKRIKRRARFVARFPKKKFSASGRPARGAPRIAIRDPIQKREVRGTRKKKTGKKKKK